MVQQFNPKRVLRQISNPLLKEFFERQGHPLDVDWDRLRNTQVDDIFDAWQRLPDAQRKAVEIAFHDVHEMADEDGTRVIIEEGQYHGEDLAPLLEPMESRYDKALWTFMNRPAVWDAAVRFAKADSLSGGRSWIKRGNVPAKNGPMFDADTLLAFQEAVSAFYRDRQGRGHHCKVEYFPRGRDQEWRRSHDGALAGSSRPGQRRVHPLRAPCGCAHNGLRLATGALSGGVGAFRRVHSANRIFNP